MLPFGVAIPATVPQRSEIPEGLMNYPYPVFQQAAPHSVSFYPRGPFQINLTPRVFEMDQNSRIYTLVNNLDRLNNHDHQDPFQSKTRLRNSKRLCNTTKLRRHGSVMSALDYHSRRHTSWAKTNRLALLWVLRDFRPHFTLTEVQQNSHFKGA